MSYVFAFEEGSKEQKFLLGGKGANLAEMTKLGLPVPPGFTITTDACKAYMAADDTIPAGLMDEVAERARRARGEDGQAARRRHRPAAGVGALGCGVLDAGDDGHRPQPRAQRRVGRRAGASRPTTRASRTTRTAGSCRCSPRSCSTSTAPSSSTRSSSCARSVASRPTRSCRPKTSRGWPTGSRRSCSPRRASSSPRTRRTSCSWRSKRCSVRGTASAPASTGKHGEDRRRPRHRGQRADHGVRQQGRRLRHRRRVHPQPGHRRERAVRRLPEERAGRRRRRRHPHHRAARRRWATSSPSVTSSCSS